MIITSRKTDVLLTMLLSSLLVLSACGSPPERTPYDGTDNIGEISAALLIGQWKVTVLNPIDKENDMTMDYQFNKDGSVIANIIPPLEQSEQLGPMEFRATGSWQTQGDIVMLTHTKFEEVNGNKLGGFMVAIMNTVASKADGKINPYDISANRMIWVHEETKEARLLERM